MGGRCVRFKGTYCLAGPLFVGCLSGQSKRLQSLRLFTNHSAVGLIFHHSLRAFFGALFLPETCFGTRTGLIRFSCQCHLLFRRGCRSVLRWCIQPCSSGRLPLSYLCSLLRIKTHANRQVTFAE